MLQEIYISLLRVVDVVNAGVVVFFTSYAYMDAFVEYLKHRETDGSSKFMQLQGKKPIFVEPRSVTDGDRMLTRYSSYAGSRAPGSKGAILFCVMGGKLSEGINFSDDLARCVVVVGMPYPDGRDPMLQERMKFADRTEANAGKSLYEAICMKAVNQSIGRSIRHTRDYAAIVLLDTRYGQMRVAEQLPDWITRSLGECASIDELQRHLRDFLGPLDREYGKLLASSKSAGTIV
jgi:chromosome transmission fidelity protein 1